MPREENAHSNDLIATLRRRLERERHARQEAERIAETVTRDIYALNQAKSEFIALVSHELRTPMTAILGFVRSLERRELRENPQILGDALEAIARNAEKLGGLLEEILSTSLFQSFDVAVSLEKIDFRKLAERIAADLDDEHLRVVFDIDPQMDPAVTDRDKVGHVLKNLLDNAAKFSPEGGTCIVGAEIEGSILRFWVQDEGIGMSKEQIDHIFEPFWQGEASLTRRFGGLGLGLHVARRITHVLGGDITVQSKPGDGSRFVVTIRTGAGAAAGRRASTSEAGRSHP